MFGTLGKLQISNKQRAHSPTTAVASLVVSSAVANTGRRASKPSDAGSDNGGPLGETSKE